MTEIVIKIPESIYKIIQKNSTAVQADGSLLENAVLNGTPLPKGHGRLVDLDDIEEQLERYGRKSVYYQLPYSPTIIEADKECEE